MHKLLELVSGGAKRFLSRHRLSRAGNRRINRALHIMAIVQLRRDTDGRSYYRRRLRDGKTPMEASRCLKRRLPDVVYRAPQPRQQRRHRCARPRRG